MKKWFTSLVLVIAVGGSALTGFAMHGGERDAKMASCCKAARARDNSQATLSAKLCCAINCTEPVPQAPSGVKVSPLVITSPHPAGIQPPALTSVTFSRFYSEPVYTSDSSPPTYIRHLALLI